MWGLRLLWVVGCVVARARCAGGARRAGPVACVESAANAEFAASPLNYAHWLLAHAYPTLVALEAAEAWPWAVVRFPLVFGVTPNHQPSSSFFVTSMRSPSWIVSSSCSAAS